MLVMFFWQEFSASINFLVVSILIKQTTVAKDCEVEMQALVFVTTHIDSNEVKGL